MLNTPLHDTIRNLPLDQDIIYKLLLVADKASDLESFLTTLVEGFDITLQDQLDTIKYELKTSESTVSDQKDEIEELKEEVKNLEYKIEE